MRRRTILALSFVVGFLFLTMRLGKTVGASYGYRVRIGRCISDTGDNRIVVISVLRDGGTRISGTDVRRSDLKPSLHEILQTRPSRPIFIEADSDATFQQLVGVIDDVPGASGELVLLTALARSSSTCR
jgi:biopolymer transport protein ExbD